jgi:hypothetical protein
MSILAMSGCGSGGGTGPVLARPELVTQANAICATTSQGIKTGAPSVFPNPNQAGVQDFGLVQKFAKTVVLPALQKEHSELVGLRATSDTDYPITLSELQSGIDRWNADKTLMATVNDTSFAQFDARADDIGMTTCGGIDGMIRTMAAGEPIST